MDEEKVEDAEETTEPEPAAKLDEDLEPADDDSDEITGGITLR